MKSMNMQCMNLVMIPEEELAHLKNSQAEILTQLKNLQPPSNNKGDLRSHITAKEYMAAVKICRSKFDQLVLTNKIKTIKKRRKIYLPSSEVERFFTDPTIQ
jgi:hypothetical protein